MKVLIVGAGFVGLTTACVLASRGVEVTIQDNNQEKMNLILNGKLPFFEPGLETLLRQILESGRLKGNDWEKLPDLTIIAVGTPSNSDGSIDTTYLELAIEECNRHLPLGSLVAIKSTIIPGTTRRIQNQSFSSNLELLMIPEFLREGSAISDATMPDRNVIGSRSQKVAVQVAQILGMAPESCIFTSTFSAESIKYLSNAFLATCISFTNEVFSSINEDEEFEIDSVILGWHSDRRFLTKESGIAELTSYLIPGPGFGGSCFPKDVRALRSSINRSGKHSKVIDAVIETNQITIEQNAQWIASQIPVDEQYIVLGMGFKDNTDDIRESPSLLLARSLTPVSHKGFWHDQHLNESSKLEGLDSASWEQISESKYFILMHHSEYYRELLKKRAETMENKNEITVFALRYQKPIEFLTWRYPRNS
jgi:UDPglucose 6-dehydrogenase